MARINMKAKMKRTLSVLNTNPHGRVYKKAIIDLGESGYYRINDQFDVEINPACFLNQDVASIFLWCKQHIEVACVREVSFEKIDELVGVWCEEIANQRPISHMRESIVLSDLYS